MIATRFVRSTLLRERAGTVMAACLGCLNLPGNIAEFGVGGGETATVLAHLARGAGKQLILVDTFDGEGSAFKILLPVDEAVDGKFARDHAHHFSHSLNEIAQRVGPETFYSTCRPFVGLFSDLPPPYSDGRKLCFIHADGDLYQSTKDIITYADSAMVVGGVMVIDDWEDPEWPGVAKAVEEVMKPRNWQTYAMEGLTQLIAVKVRE